MNEFKMNPSFLMFSYGRRDCIGRQFAIKQLFFIFGNLILKYKFKLDKNINQKTFKFNFKESFVNTLHPQIGVNVQKV